MSPVAYEKYLARKISLKVKLLPLGEFKENSVALREKQRSSCFHFALRELQIRGTKQSKVFSIQLSTKWVLVETTMKYFFTLRKENCNINFQPSNLHSNKK
jgi:hypothetical protein